ncbi:MAG: nucleoside triphosphate pyrophosphohydrolase, partial [Candidatus Dormibacteraceae bacterium]
MPSNKPESAAPTPPYPPGIEAIFQLARRLRAPDGCPWDRQQTHRSMRPHLLEETYELLEAIDRDDDDAHLIEELGDVLLQVAMHAAIAESEGRFDATRVSEAAAAKMVSRHPHVFGDVEAHDADEVLRNWEHQKAAVAAQAGRGEETVLDRVPPELPALAWTFNMQKRGARMGFDLDSVESASTRILELTKELTNPNEDQVGELLFAVVALARKLKINPEDALRVTGQRFRDRFAEMDRLRRERELTYEELNPA